MHRILIVIECNPLEEQLILFVLLLESDAYNTYRIVIDRVYDFQQTKVDSDTYHALKGINIIDCNAWIITI